MAHSSFLFFFSEDFYQTCGRHEIHMKNFQAQIHVKTTKIDHEVNFKVAEP